MRRTIDAFRFAPILVLAIATLPALTQTKTGGQKTAARPVKQFTNTATASVQTNRNVGKAYFEQGKYVEAIEQFQKVVASGKASATDHLSLGMSLMQANKLDASLGEMT